MNKAIEGAVMIYSENDIHADGRYYDYGNDRLIHQLTSRCLSQDDIVEQCREAFTRFDRDSEDCEPSRCEVRVRAESDARAEDLAAELPQGCQVADYPVGELRDYFFDGSIRYRECIIGLNNRRRELPDVYREKFYRMLHRKIKASLQELYKKGGAQLHSRKTLDSIAGKAYADKALRNQVDSERIHALWAETYGWNPEQCDRYIEASHAGNESQLYLMRESADDQIIATLLVTHEGEGTAGATADDSERVPHASAYAALALYATADWLCQSIDDGKNRPIPFAFSWWRALFANMYSGMWNEAIEGVAANLREAGSQGGEIDAQKILERSVLLNSFALNAEGMPPAPWNIEKGALPDGRPFSDLRSFTIGSFQRFFYGPNIDENLNVYRELRERLSSR